MVGLELLSDLGLMVGLAAAMSLVLSGMRVPALVAYLVAGLLLGPGLGWVEPNPLLELASKLGTSLLLFLVGLELTFARLRDVGRVAVVAGVGQVVFTAGGGTALALLLGFPLLEAAIVATALTFSSTVIVVKLLDQKGELNELYGRIAVGIFVVQDLIAIGALTVLGGLGASPHGGEGALATGLGRTIVGSGLLLAAALVAARWALPRTFSRVGTSPQIVLVWSLAWCLGFIATAERLGISIEVGAFLAGLSLAQIDQAAALRRRVHPLMDFFVAVFFVTLGTELELDAALGSAGAVGAFTLFVLVGNPLIFMILITRMGYGERTAFLCSVTVAQISEFSLLFIALAAAGGLVSTESVSLVALVGLLTFAASAYMILHSQTLYAWARRAGILRIFRAPADPPAPPARVLRGHVVVVGMNALGRAIVNRLASKGDTVVAIDTDVRKLEGLPAMRVIGDANHPGTLAEAHLANARLMVSALQIEDTTRLLVHRCRALGVLCAVHAFDPSLNRDLQALGADGLLEPKKAAAREILGELRRQRVLGS